MKKMIWTKELIREKIRRVLPEGRVVPRHNERGHFYEVIDGKFLTPPIYPSVTGKLQIIKDEGLINYKMNKVLEYMFAHWKEFNENNIMQHIEAAERVPADILADAGDVGTTVHDTREKIFDQWIETGERPQDFLAFIPEGVEDVRVVSALRALQKFCEEKDYIPVHCELLVYSHKLKVAGTLDDLGLMKKYKRRPEVDCECLKSNEVVDKNGWHRCVRCDAKYKYEFVLMDLKTSNAFKDHYFFQVCLYWWMLGELLGKEWLPERCFILKVSKEDGSYKIEDLKMPAKLAQYARYMLKTNEGVDFIKSLRRDNQRNVAPFMQL